MYIAYHLGVHPTELGRLGSGLGFVMLASDPGWLPSSSERQSGEDNP